MIRSIRRPIVALIAAASGLAIVRRTIEDFGGKVTFQSKPNEGTTFTITLPSVKQQQARVHRVLKELALQKAAG